MKVQGAIFDFDGTLMDSMTIWATIGERYLRSLGIEPRERLAETFKKMSIFEAACYYIKEYGVQLSTEEIQCGVNEMIEKEYREHIETKSGIRELLAFFQGKGVKMCIATATEEPLVRLSLQRNGIAHYFDSIITCRVAGYGKSRPDVYEMALATIGTEKSATPVFEDSLYAAMTAKRAGFPVVGVYDVFEDRQADLRSIADVYVTDFQELIVEGKEMLQ